MSNPSETQDAHQFAGQIEEGFSPVATKSATFSEKTDAIPAITRSSTFSSSFKKALTWTSSFGEGLVPKIPKAKGEAWTRTLEEYPNGYPRLSFVLNSDESFMMYRQFGQLHSRVLLHKQDQLRAMEEDLKELDEIDSEGSDAKYLRCREDDELRAPPRRGKSRTQLMDDIEEKLLEYGKVLKQTHRLQNMAKPHHRDHASVYNWVRSNRPLVEEDEDFVYRREDMVSLQDSPRERAWLDGILERFLHSFLRWYPTSQVVKKVFCTEEGRLKSQDERFHYFDRNRINYVVTVLISLVLLPILIIPIYVLYYLTVIRHFSVADPTCIAVLLVSAFIFSVILGIFTQAKRHETLAAAAGYCAVLVVFLSNPVSGGSG